MNKVIKTSKQAVPTQAVPTTVERKWLSIFNIFLNDNKDSSQSLGLSIRKGVNASFEIDGERYDMVGGEKTSKLTGFTNNYMRANRQDPQFIGKLKKANFA